MTTAKPKKPKRDRPENPEYQEAVHIDASPKDVVRAIMREPPKPEPEWRYLKDKPRWPRVLSRAVHGPPCFSLPPS